MINLFSKWILLIYRKIWVFEVFLIKLYSKPTNSGSPVYEVIVTDGKVTAVSNTVGKGEIAENTYILVGRERDKEN